MNKVPSHPLPQLTSEEINIHNSASGYFYMTKAGVSGASDNFTVCPKTGVCGVTQKS